MGGRCLGSGTGLRGQAVGGRSAEEGGLKWPVLSFYLGLIKGFQTTVLILRYSNLAIFHPPFVAVAEVVEVGAECLLLLPSIHQGPLKAYLSVPGGLCFFWPKKLVKTLRKRCF